MAEDDFAELGADRSLLLVDDDVPFLTRLARAMEKRGFQEKTPPRILNTRSCCRSFQVANNIKPNSSASPTR